MSTPDPELSLPWEALKAAGCEPVFTAKASGAQRDRPQLKAALDYRRPGDTLVVWKLDRLARSMKPLIETVEGLGAREIGFQSLTEALGTTTAGGKLIFHLFASLAEFERALSESDWAAAKALLKDPTMTVDAVARRLKVAPSTLYRALPGGRSGLGDTEK